MILEHPSILDQQTKVGEGVLVKNDKSEKDKQNRVVELLQMGFCGVFATIPNLHHIHLITKGNKCKYIFFVFRYFFIVFLQAGFHL